MDAKQEVEMTTEPRLISTGGSFDDIQSLVNGMNDCMSFQETEHFNCNHNINCQLLCIKC